MCPVPAPSCAERRRQDSGESSCRVGVVVRASHAMLADLRALVFRRVPVPLPHWYSIGAVRQVIHVTNSMQGTKTLMMKMKIGFSRGDTPVAEVAQVGQFPPGY